MRSSIVLFACFYDSNLFHEQLKLLMSSRGASGGFRLCVPSA